MSYSQIFKLIALTAGAAFASAIAPVQAATVSGGTILDGAGANLVETEIGSARLFTHTWSGEGTLATSASFHAAADAYGRTLTIYNIQHHSGEVLRVGGYTPLRWGGEFRRDTASYDLDSAAFLFNLDNGEVWRGTAGDTASLYRHGNYFPTFGSGRGPMGARGLPSSDYGTRQQSTPAGQSNFPSDDDTQGPIVIAGDSGSDGDDSGWALFPSQVLGTEVYGAEDAPAIPLPAGWPLLLTGIAGFGALRIRRRSAR